MSKKAGNLFNELGHRQATGDAKKFVKRQHKKTERTLFKSNEALSKLRRKQDKNLKLHASQEDLMWREPKPSGFGSASGTSGFGSSAFGTSTQTQKKVKPKIKKYNKAIKNETKINRTLRQQYQSTHPDASKEDIRYAAWRSRRAERAERKANLGKKLGQRVVDYGRGGKVYY